MSQQTCSISRYVSHPVLWIWHPTCIEHIISEGVLRISSSIAIVAMQCSQFLHLVSNRQHRNEIKIHKFVNLWTMDITNFVIDKHNMETKNYDITSILSFRECLNVYFLELCQHDLILLVRKTHQCHSQVLSFTKPNSLLHVTK